MFGFQPTGVLEELGTFERHWQIPRTKLLHVVRLFLRRIPWRLGKRLNMCWKPWRGTENDFNHWVFWCYENITVVRYCDSLVSWHWHYDTREPILPLLYPHQSQRLTEFSKFSKFSEQKKTNKQTTRRQIPLAPSVFEVFGRFLHDGGVPFVSYRTV